MQETFDILLLLVYPILILAKKYERLCNINLTV